MSKVQIPPPYCCHQQKKKKKKKKNEPEPANVAARLRSMMITQDFFDDEEMPLDVIAQYRLKRPKSINFLHSMMPALNSYWYCR